MHFKSLQLIGVTAISYWTYFLIQDNVPSPQAADTDTWIHSGYQSGRYSRCTQLHNQCRCSQTGVTSYLWSDTYPRTQIDPWPWWYQFDDFIVFLLEFGGKNASFLFSFRKNSSTSSRLSDPRAQRLQHLSGGIPGEYRCRWPLPSTNSSWPIH